MNQFTLFAHGEAFDVDAFLATTSLQPDYFWRRGDQRRYACIESKHTTSGFELVLGDGRVIPFLEQEGIAIEYIKAHWDELRAVAKFPGVNSLILGLQYHLELDETTIGFCMGPSLLLMSHALDIGVEPTYYVSLGRRREWKSKDN